MKKRIIGMITAALLAASLPVCASGLTAVGLETENVGRQWEKHAFFERMEALTGVAVEGRGITETKEWQKTLAAMEKGERPADILFKANLSRSEEKKLLDAGALVDLSPLIGENMPKLSALLEAHPEWRKIIALPDGRIPSLPLLNTEEQQVCVWINAEWLEALGLSMPGTAGELTAALRAFRDGDPNGNGKQDEKVMDVTGVWELRWFLPYFGVVADDWQLARRTDGSLAFAPDLPEYRAFVSCLKGWYEEGILTEAAFTETHTARVMDQASSRQSQQEEPVPGLIVSVTPLTAVQVPQAVHYRALLMAHEGVTRWRDLLGEVWTGCMAVTSACGDPAAALRWADALYGEEGALLGWAGQEGDDWHWKPDGTWGYMTDEQRTIEDIRSSAIINTGTQMPGLYPGAFIAKVDSEADRWIIAETAKVRQAAEQVVKPYSLAGEEAERAAKLAAKLGRLVDEGIARFVTGEIPLDDASWSAWLESLHAAGSGELLQLFAEAE